MRSLAAILLSVSLLYPSEPPKFAVTPDMQSALERILPDSLKGHLSFIASDLLEGRNTPSPGLDIAAEYIAHSSGALAWNLAGTMVATCKRPSSSCKNRTWTGSHCN